MTSRAAVALLALFMGGCCATLPPPAPLPIPERLELIDWNQAEWSRLPPDIQDKIDFNSEQLKRMVVELEAIVRAHNEALED